MNSSELKKWLGNSVNDENRPENYTKLAEEADDLYKSGLKTTLFGQSTLTTEQPEYNFVTDEAKHLNREDVPNDLILLVKAIRALDRSEITEGVLSNESLVLHTSSNNEFIIVFSKNSIDFVSLYVQDDFPAISSVSTYASFSEFLDTIYKLLYTLALAFNFSSIQYSNVTDSRVENWCIGNNMAKGVTELTYTSGVSKTL